MSLQSPWYNYKTKKYEVRGTIKFYDEALDYLPQSPTIRGLMAVSQRENLPVLEAMKEILLITTSTKGNEPV